MTTKKATSKPKREPKFSDKVLRRVHRRLVKVAPLLSRDDVRAALAEELTAIDAVMALEDKYFKLVWYARSDKVLPKERADLPLNNRSEIDARHTEIEAAYPEEVANLAFDEEAAWHHGFNSGCLAAARLIMGAHDGGDLWQLAQDSFPMLDS